MATIFRSERRFRAAQRLGRMAETPLVRKDGRARLDHAGSPACSAAGRRPATSSDMPKETFREWWEKREHQ